MRHVTDASRANKDPEVQIRAYFSEPIGNRSRAAHQDVAAGFELFGVSRYLSVPVAAVAVSTLVVRGSFHRIERVLLAVSAVFVTYVVAGILAGPDWGAAARGTVVPSLPTTRDAVALATATIGTTLAPWGLSFIQSYAADKRLTSGDLRAERVDVLTGAALTGVIGFFVVVACAATPAKNVAANMR